MTLLRLLTFLLLLTIVNFLNYRLRKKDRSSDSKVKFRQDSNRCKRVLEVAKLAYYNKTKESITSQKFGSRDFWQIVNSLLNKVNLLYLLYSTARG